MEVDPESAEVVKLDGADVLSADAAAEHLGPHIRDLPPFDEESMGVAT